MSRKKKQEHTNHDRWLVSYADFITLLFAFFVHDRDVKERVGVAEKKLGDLSLNGYRLGRIVCRGERMMSGYGIWQQQRSNKHKHHDTLHTLS